MTFTYDVSTARGQVRLTIGDTVSTSPLLQDAEVDYFLTNNNNSVISAAAAAARAIAATFSRLADTTVETVSVSHSQKSAQYSKLASQLEAKGASSAANSPTPYVGGTSNADIEGRNANSDRPTPAFIEGQFDNPANNPLPGKFIP